MVMEGLPWDQGIKTTAVDDASPKKRKAAGGREVSLYRGSSPTSLSKCIDVGLLCWQAARGQLEASSRPAQRVSSLAAKRRGEVWWQGSQRERRQPAQTRPASAIRQRQQTLGRNKRRSFASSKSNLHLPPPPKPTPTPPVKRPKEKKRPPRKECLARHCPDQRPPAKIKELAAFSDPTSSFFLSTMHAAADADCCSCPLNSPLEPSYRASSLPRRHRLHPVPSPSPSPSTSPSTSSHLRDPTTTDRLSGSSDPRP